MSFKPLRSPYFKSSITQEGITVNKWYKDSNADMRPHASRIRNAAFLAAVPSFFFVNIFPPAAPVIGPQSVGITYRRVMQYKMLTQPVTTVNAERATPDKWLPSEERSLPSVKPKTYTYPFFFTDTNANAAPVEDVTVDKWHPEPNKPQMKGKNFTYTYPYSFPDPYQLTQKEVSTPDKWIGYHPDKLFDIKRIQYAYPVMPTGLEEEPASEISVDSWFVTTERPRFDIKRQQYTSPFFFDNPYGLTLREDVKMSSWFVNTNRPRFDLKRNQWLYPTFFIDPTAMIIPTIDIGFTSSIPVRITYRRLTQYKMLTQPTTINTVERTTMDKWLGYHPDYIFSVKRWQFTYKFFNFSDEFCGISIWKVMVAKPYIDYTRLAKTAVTYTKTEKLTRTYSKVAKPSTTFTKGAKPTTVWTRIANENDTDCAI